VVSKNGSGAINSFALSQTIGKFHSQHHFWVCSP